jgi:hypothetical protein
MEVTATSERHVPQRTCLGCRRRRPAGELVRARVTADGHGVWGPAAARLPGRGAWICPGSTACFDVAARRGAFARAWRRPLTPAAINELRASFCALDVRQSMASVEDHALRKG